MRAWAHRRMLWVMVVITIALICIKNVLGVNYTINDTRITSVTFFLIPTISLMGGGNISISGRTEINNSFSVHPLTMLVCTNDQLDRLRFSNRYGCQPIDTPCLVASNFTDSINVLVNVPVYDSYNVLVANCAPSSSRMPYNISMNVSYINKNGHLTCGQIPYPAMYEICWLCWVGIFVFLVHRILRDFDTTIQLNFTTKNLLTSFVCAYCLAFAVHAQVSASYYRLADTTGNIDAQPFNWLIPILYVTREMVMYGVVMILSGGWRVAPHFRYKEHLLFSFAALDINGLFAFLFIYPTNSILIAIGFWLHVISRMLLILLAEVTTSHYINELARSGIADNGQWYPPIDTPIFEDFERYRYFRFIRNIHRILCFLDVWTYVVVYCSVEEWKWTVEFAEQCIWIIITIFYVIALRRRPKNRAMLQLPIPRPAPAPAGAGGAEMEDVSAEDMMLASHVHNRAVQARTALMLAHIRHSGHRRMLSNSNNE